MSTIIQSIENEQLQRRPRFAAGDRVRVHFQVIEGSRTRTQVFEGVVIKRQGSGARETFTVRKQSFGVGVERTFPVHSPKIEQLEVAGRGDVRRAKLYYLRDRVGKAARVSERRWGIGDALLGSSEDGAVDSEGTTQGEAPQAVPATGGEGDGEAVVEVEGGAPEGEEAGAEGDAGGEAAEPEKDDAEADAPSADPETADASPDAAAESEAGEQAAAQSEDDGGSSGQGG